MLMLLYVILAWVLTPLAYQFVNRQATADGRLRDTVKGWPSWALNVVVCALVAFVVTALPGGWKLTIWNLFNLTAIVYFGNQAFYNSVVKPFAARRAALHTFNPKSWS